MRRHEFVSFGGCLVTLRKVNVHLVAVKVRIVGAAVGVVQAQGLLFGQDARQVSHYRRLVQSWLPIDQQNVAIC